MKTFKILLTNLLCFLFLVSSLIGCKDRQDEKKIKEVPGLTEITSRSFGGKTISFNDLENRLATVFMFLSPQCPIAQKYTSRSDSIYQKFKVHNIEFYGVFPGFLADKKEAKTFQSDYNLTYTLLKDSDFELLNLFDARISPEVFVVDNKGVIRYQGQIDNWFFGLGKRRTVITEHYLVDALNALVNNEAISTTQTKAIGCYLPRK